MNVFSSFNGMGCLWLALDALGVKVDTRYSSEIDKYANFINDKNYPDTIQLGDIRNAESFTESTGNCNEHLQPMLVRAD